MKRMRNWSSGCSKWAWPFLMLCFSTAVHAEQPPNQYELNGFLIGQYEEVPAQYFGKPIQETTTPDGWLYRVYALDKKPTGYMAFKFPPGKENYRQAAIIEVSGYSKAPSPPFMGLELGASRKDVIDKLGEPSKITHEKDDVFEGDLLVFGDKNYNIEIDQTGKLYSIQITDYSGSSPPDAKEIDADVQRFKSGISEGNVDVLMASLAPDLEINKGGHVYRFSGPARLDLENTASDIHKLLMDKTESLRSVFLSEGAVGEINFRFYEKGPMNFVEKFPQSKELEEIVYTFYAGSWRVWEITFR